MLFNSFLYVLAFLPLVACGNALLLRWGGARVAQAGLLAASLGFYAYAGVAHLPLLIGSILFNWAVARQLAPRADARHCSAWLWFGVAANLVFLGSFKYVNFFVGQLAGAFGTAVSLPNWDFPLGISFFTLTQVMYLVDCYQEVGSPISLFDHASVVSFFPYVSSGPLVRAGEIAPQFRRFSFQESRLDLACRGLFLFTLGLAKKVIFADTFATMANAGFGAVGTLSALEFWAFSLAYTFQIYFDFSGYSDMALGTAWMLGFDIPQNFKSPYISKSISEFWQRWHISLSNFITSYLYTPILRSLGKATLRTSAVATLLAMGIAGLWHGPGWTYILFGLLHGSALAINQVWRKSKRKLPPGLGWFVTFLFVDCAFVVFRSPDLPTAVTMFSRLVPHGDVFGTSVLQAAVPPSPILIARLTLGVVLAFFFQGSWERAASFKRDYRTALSTAGLFALDLFFLNSSVAKPFVYFAF